jgi:hypothetical protein
VSLTIEFCGLDAVDALMRFIREHWSETHILGHSRALMDWQHRNEADGRYNFMLARDDAGAIVGILGFIPSSRYDPALGAGDETIWFAMWKVLETAPTGAGLMLIRELQKRIRPRWIGTVGLNDYVREIYRALGYTTATLDRYYRLNRRRATDRLIVCPSGWPDPVEKQGSTRLVPIDAQMLAAMDPALGTAQSPRKTPQGLVTRYLSHPFYDYHAYRVEGAETAVIVTRLCAHEDAVALRIVDILGPASALAGAAAALDALMAETGAEFIDFYLSGGDEALAAAGFSKLDAQGGLVLPSYFEPFDRSNVEVVYALKGPDTNLTICKGDADQDRPNILAPGHGLAKFSDDR